MQDFDPFADPMKGKEDEKSKEDQKPKEPSPDEIAEKYKAEAEAAKAEADRVKAEAAAARATYEQNLSQFTEALAGRYEQKTQRQEPEPEPELTDSSFDKSPKTATEMVAKKEVKKAMEEVGNYYGGIIGNLTETAFEGQMASLNNERFFKYVEPEVRKFFEANPQGKINPQAARTVYEKLVGQHIEELLEAEKKDQASIETERQKLVTGSTVRPNVREETVPRTPSTLSRLTPEEDKTPQMTPNEQKIYDIYSYYGVFDSEDDWHQWKEAITSTPRSEIPFDYARGGKN
jgi:hypothetical protein